MLKNSARQESPQAILQREQTAPSSLTPQDIIQLQRTIGNRAVQRLIKDRNKSTKPETAPSLQVVQRNPRDAHVVKKGGAALHKTKVKNGALRVRRGGIFGQGKVTTVPKTASLTVDYDYSIGNYVQGVYNGQTGYINKANIALKYVDDTAASIALARLLLDSYIETHTVQQHIKNDEEYQASVKQGMRSLLGAIKHVQFQPKTETNTQTEEGTETPKRTIVDPAATPQYWQDKGTDLLATQQQNLQEVRQGNGEKIPMTCDQSTAIIIATLANHPLFYSSLTIIKQGDPKQHGHWYVLANRHPDNDNPQYGDQLRQGEFIIDIWGSLNLKEGDSTINTVVYTEGGNGLFNASVFSSREENEARWAQQNRLKAMVTYPQKE